MDKDYAVEIAAGTEAAHALRFACASGQPVLLAALAAGIRLPHSCRNGTCRSCVAQLLEGEIEYLIEWPGLLREEKAAGWILPCVACPRSDLKLTLQLHSA